MQAVELNEAQLRRLVKEALIEALEERQDLLRGLLEEIVEDVALVQAIQEGETSPPVSREDVFRALEEAC